MLRIKPQVNILKNRRGTTTICADINGISVITIKPKQANRELHLILTIIYVRYIFN